MKNVVFKLIRFYLTYPSNLIKWAFLIFCVEIAISLVIFIIKWFFFQGNSLTWSYLFSNYIMTENIIIFLSYLLGSGVFILREFGLFIFLLIIVISWLEIQVKNVVVLVSYW